MMRFIFIPHGLRMVNTNLTVVSKDSAVFLSKISGILARFTLERLPTIKTLKKNPKFGDN
ncbi:MAG: hypothetical protein DMG11_24700 [Acidobacteria bacterium]|nr:MAG: hypothetical protein DMG11_24700 [Acidobacteriota bacterium]